MCLVIKKDAQIQVAQNDIPVYKLCLFEEATQNLTTPMQNQLVHIGETYNTDGVFTPFNPEEDERECNRMEEDEVYVEAGLLHSFLVKEEALNVLKMYNHVYELNRNIKPLLVNCTIPKGSKYLTGWCRFQRTFMFGITLEEHVCQSIGSTAVRYDSFEKISNE